MVEALLHSFTLSRPFQSRGSGLIDKSPVLLLLLLFATPQPDYYANKPSTHWNGTKLVASFNDYLSCCFHTEWYSMAEALSCRNGPDSCEQYQFTGPVWGHLNLRTTTIDWFLK